MPDHDHRSGRLLRHRAVHRGAGAAQRHRPPPHRALDAPHVERLVLGLLDADLRERFHHDKEIDFSFSWREQIRFRANVFRQQGTIALALRAIPFDIPTFDELGLPPIMEYFAGLPQGLLLVTGPTGSGKSTTQASVIDYINHTRA